MTAPSIRIDWQRVALNLRSHGIQLQAASRKLGKHAGWLGQMAREEIGRGVEFHDGLRLLDYHLSVCGEAAHLALLSPQQHLPIQEPKRSPAQQSPAPPESSHDHQD